MAIFALDSFDLSTGEIVCNLYFLISWRDELIAWNPLEHGNITGFTVPKGKLWTPKIVLNGQTSNSEASLIDSDFSPSYVWFNGELLLAPAGKYRALCQLDTKYYPFDKHLCSFDVSVENHMATELTLNSPMTRILLDPFQGHPEWKVIAAGDKLRYFTTGRIAQSTISLQHTFYLKRKPMFEIFSTLLPLLFLNVLSIASIYVSPCSGERVSYAITVYLAFVFATTSLYGVLPRNSEEMTLPTIFTFVYNILNAVNVLWSMFIVWVAGLSSDRVDKNIPNCLKILVQSKNKPDTVANVLKSLWNRNKVRHLDNDGNNQNNDHGLEIEEAVEDDHQSGHFHETHNPTGHFQETHNPSGHLHETQNPTGHFHETHNPSGHFHESTDEMRNNLNDHDVNAANKLSGADIAKTFDRYFFCVSLISNSTFLIALAVVCFVHVL
ncbi:5-hydroxytryptamine receptor 3A-like [Mya arenaria]|uniref:5-hydroxytryptamine receptor 3A-like n=1 Tax=Mya arenaria TaxID=6604 RepID=UPI0022E23B40|nr:5-hydroxytryptamine receptor 3A-like [Mya arenaria]